MQIDVDEDVLHLYHESHPNASLFQSRTFPRACHRTCPTQIQLIPATPRINATFAATFIATPSNSEPSRASTSDVSSFFFSPSSSSADGTTSFSTKHDLAHSSSLSSFRCCTFRGTDAVVFRRMFPRNISAEKLKERLSVIRGNRHANTTQLIRASVSGQYVDLVYEFVDGPKLSDCLTSPGNPYFDALSTWMSRMEIALHVARGLDYIHHRTGCKTVFIHNRIKSSNIIVTSEPSLGAVICNFGIAHACGEAGDDCANESSSEGEDSLPPLPPKGSIEDEEGYMSPELHSEGIATQKSDVYAFGIVLLELLSGNEPLNCQDNEADKEFVRASIVETARGVMDDGGDDGEREKRVGLWMDRRFNGLFPVKIAEKVMRVALSCVHEDPKVRPDMGLVETKIFNCYRKSEKFLRLTGTGIIFPKVLFR